MAIKNTKAQTFIVDTDLGGRIQLLLATARVEKKKLSFKDISDFVNIAIKEKLLKEERA
jgi:hypothetical protein